MDENNTVTEPVAPVSNADESQVATTETVATAPVQAETAEEPLLAGKYKSTEELERGYKELEKKLGSSAAATPPTSQVPVPGYAPVPPMANTPQLDPDSEVAVQRLIDARMEAARVADFQRRNATDLANPVILGTTTGIIQQENAAGRYISQEDALAQAKAAIEELSKPKVAEAAATSLAEGQDLARQKEKMGAIGDTNKVAPPVNAEALSAEEYAKTMNIPVFKG